MRGEQPRGDRAGPRQVRSEIRAGRWRGTTSGAAPGYAQANLVVLPRDLAFDFLVYAQRNPKPCPVLEVLEPGDPVPRMTAPDADIRTDLPGYRVYENGELVEEREDVRGLWREDAVAVLIGCSFTFEEALIEAGVPVRHLETGSNVPMYRTSWPARPAGRFSGPLVVSMRPVPAELVGRAVQATARFPAVHGAPVHVGSPDRLGIDHLDEPDYGDPVAIRDGELPVFWACGVTPQAVAAESRPGWLVTHAPGQMFVTDVPNASLDLALGDDLQ